MEKGEPEEEGERVEEKTEAAEANGRGELSTASNTSDTPFMLMLFVEVVADNTVEPARFEASGCEFFVLASKTDTAEDGETSGGKVAKDVLNGENDDDCVKGEKEEEDAKEEKGDEAKEEDGGGGEVAKSMAGAANASSASDTPVMLIS
eukprot:gnl/MRDRNA2_/MRDRNA2_56684_c0_seq2.p2 gnl/MRDRNA2_/MRDRNA2_56684_c0~~gnl/MRDRNA2_/MRDRNA2_56684_c0_seq2.p2  ORF type:complete len:149 (+),score=55.03 gnl/MRDRNA2_/MRDRNA2_56684_c0_seq2:185-631(+)